jgi:hypothetical protein
MIHSIDFYYHSFCRNYYGWSCDYFVKLMHVTHVGGIQDSLIVDRTWQYLPKRFFWPPGWLPCGFSETRIYFGRSNEEKGGRGKNGNIWANLLFEWWTLKKSTQSMFNILKENLDYKKVSTSIYLYSLAFSKRLIWLQHFSKLLDPHTQFFMFRLNRFLLFILCYIHIKNPYFFQINAKYLWLK